jgi:hypothetical protein
VSVELNTAWPAVALIRAAACFGNFLRLINAEFRIPAG